MSEGTSKSLRDKTVEVAEVESDVSDASDNLSALLHPRISKKDGVSTRSREESKKSGAISPSTQCLKEMPTSRNLWWMVGTRCQGVGISVG